MNIWKWVNELDTDLRKGGQARLADLLERIPSATCDDRHEEVDALAPEALALARGLELPWVEVFIRHWALQSRVLHRMDATALPEAVRLLDFAHGGAARGCPQAVCAVQDLAACYTHVDGPGYSEDRLAVSTEALAGIDPSWSCFGCITEEYVGALNDLGRYEEALAFHDAQERAAVELDPRAFASRFEVRTAALLGLDRDEEALAFLEQRGRKLSSGHDRSKHALLKALVLARLGRAEPALEAFGIVTDPLHTPTLYAAWCDAAAALVRIGAIPNDVSLGRTLAQMIARLDRQAVGRAIVTIAELAGRLAIGRGSEMVARAALAAMEKALARLAKPLDAPDRIAQLRGEIDAMPAHDVALPDTVDAFLATFENDSTRGREAALAPLEAARRRWPDDPRIALAAWRALRGLGLDSDACSMIRAFSDAHPDNTDAALALGHSLIGLRDGAAVEELANRLLVGADPSDGHWLFAQWAMAQRDYRNAIEHGLAVLERAPEAINTRRLILAAARERRDWQLALRMARELVARLPEPSDADWDRIVAGSVVGAWDEVRESARRIGMEIDGEGPIDSDGDLCRLRFEEPSGRRVQLFARRTGPATARVVQIVGARGTERYDDVVVFEPSPIDESGSKQKPQSPLFQVLETVRSGGYSSYTLDGVHPGEEAIDALRSVLRERGVGLQIMSDEDYELRPGGGSESLLGVYAFIAVPVGMTAIEANTLLVEATSGWSEPVTWIDLATAAGDAALADVQRETAVRLGL